MKNALKTYLFIFSQIIFINHSFKNKKKYNIVGICEFGFGFICDIFIELENDWIKVWGLKMYLCFE